ncbi:glycosyltransferase [Gulosibacter macacae]|uniref:Glycosyltransferase n=1 Tax=Gulosibacter macacae TaxID=2488791 RepID=A0A3P3VWS4_9MICO|nr:glycosyltransferase [Gulosibacter macacae]RRJ86787.1 glycosyltransferase [Gulosibacter macacae]
MTGITSVTAIVVVWNGGDEAVAALRTLAAQEVDADLRIVAVDNGSTDDTVTLIRAEVPEVTVLELVENLGYGAAANRAMAAYAADAYLVLNQDADYQPGFIAALVSALDRDDSLGAVTAQVRLAGEFTKVGWSSGALRHSKGSEAHSSFGRSSSEAYRDPNPTPETIFTAHDGSTWRRTTPGEQGQQLLNSTGNQLTRSGNGLDRGWLAPVGTEFPRAVYGFHGGACALRASAVERLGGFDESYFMYYEDTDLSMRLRQAGWSIEYVPEAISIHAHASSSGTTSPRFVEWNARNRAWNARRNGPAKMRAEATVRTAVGAVKGAVTSLDPRKSADERQLGRARARGALAGLTPFPPAAGRAAPEPNVAGRVAPNDPLAGRVGPQGSLVGGVGPQGRIETTPRPTRNPRTLIDLTSIPTQLGGVGRYLEGLVSGLHALGEKPLLVARPEHIEHFRALAPNAEIHAAPALIGKKGLRFGWEQTGLLRLASDLQAEVIHSPHYTFPRATPLARVVTVHDATFFSDPDAHTKVKREFFRRWIREGVRANVTLIAPSAATASEIEAHAGKPRRAIAVALHGVDREIFHEPSADEIAAFRDAHDLGDRPYIAFLGTIEPRKQVAQLIRAHGILRERLGDEAPLLLLSGQRGWDEEAAELLDKAAADPLSGVRELGYLPLEQLRALLGGAVAFCYPSIAEGFGLPVLEAMSSGAPVVTTRFTALPEVGGDAVVYAQPNPKALADALEELITNDDERDRLRAAGLARAAEFTWERCAQLHLDAYARAAAARR